MQSLVRKALATVFWLPATGSLFLVRVYRLVLSPDHGMLRHAFPYGFCRHEPTCSAFAEIQLRTVLYPLAVYRIIRRILSCHPWTKLTDNKMRSVIEKASR